MFNLVFCTRENREMRFEEKVMADFTKLNDDIAALSAKVDALLAKQNQPPVDEQPWRPQHAGWPSRLRSHFARRLGRAAARNGIDGFRGARPHLSPAAQMREPDRA